MGIDSIRRAQPLLGTFVEISATGAARRDLEQVVAAAFEAIAAVQRLMSFHEPTSDVSRLNRDAYREAIAVSPWTFQVLKTAVELHNRSAGLFDIAIAPALQSQGLLPGAVPSADSGRRSTTACVELLPDHCVRFRGRGLRIDLGGIAKGFAVDRAVDILRESGIDWGLVNAGGDLSIFGATPQSVWIRDPRRPERLLSQVDIDNQALASTGGRFDPFQSREPRESTVIDPTTQQPAYRILGATVRAPSCMMADALTKVVMLAGERSATLLAQERASVMFMTAEGDVHQTADWQAVRLAA